MNTQFPLRDLLRQSIYGARHGFQLSVLSYNLGNSDRHGGGRELRPRHKKIRSGEAEPE